MTRKIMINEKMKDRVARIVADLDNDYDAPYDDLPHHQQLSCQVAADFFFEILFRYGEALKNENKRTI